MQNAIFLLAACYLARFCLPSDLITFNDKATAKNVGVSCHRNFIILFGKHLAAIRVIGGPVAGQSSFCAERLNSTKIAPSSNRAAAFSICASFGEGVSDGHMLTINSDLQNVSMSALIHFWLQKNQFSMCPSDKRFRINNFLQDTRVIIFERFKSEMARLTVSIVRQR